ncbi:hypothetical protein B5X24_HaOG214153 [Helicoverpa armigera]|uniref:Uncharacterized protein n=1 Tax=Helicoverpa armigera TaxID=29058 RepID=A0A2W1B370_HELAM|nr:hypothetical protein B5X24_HaOG214153 [Helicoverpa armigera]
MSNAYGDIAREASLLLEADAQLRWRVQHFFFTCRCLCIRHHHLSSLFPMFNYVGVGFQFNRMQVSTSVLQEATAYLTSSPQLPGQPKYRLVRLAVGLSGFLLLICNDCQGYSMTAGTYSLSCFPKHGRHYGHPSTGRLRHPLLNFLMDQSARLWLSARSAADVPANLPAPHCACACRHVPPRSPHVLGAMLIF